MEKYNGLVTFLRNQGINVTYGAVIVSSVGAVFHETIKDINRIFIDRRKCKTIIKRLAINSIIGSINVWNHYSRPPNNSVNSTNTANSVIMPNSIEDIPEDILESLDAINSSDQSQSCLATETDTDQHPDSPTVPSYDNEAPGDALIACNNNVPNNKEFIYVSASDSDEIVEDDSLSDDDEQ